MDFDNALVSALIISGDVDKFRRMQKMGITHERLKGEAVVAWVFIEKYIEEHNTLPGASLLTHKTGMTVEPQDAATVEYLAKHILKRHLWRLQRAAQEELAQIIQEKDPEKYRDRVMALMAEMDGVRITNTSEVPTLFSFGAQVKQQYQNTKEGIIGIPWIWPTMNKMTMGKWPGTVTLFYARPGTGKTWTLMVDARHTWQQGKKKLLISPEMGGAELYERFIAVEADVSYRDMVGATLATILEEKFKARIDALMDEQGLWVLEEKDGGLDPRRVEEAAMDLGVDEIAIDSVYSMHVGKGSRLERMSAISEWLKRLAKRTNKVVTASSQFNSSMDGAKKASMKGAALSDQMNWDADNLFGMIQTRDMRDDNWLIYDPMKVRRAAFSAQIMVQWDFVKMQFQEIDAKAKKLFEDKGSDELAF